MKKMQRKEQRTLIAYGTCGCQAYCSCASCASASVPNDQILKEQRKDSLHDDKYRPAKSRIAIYS